MTQGAMTSDSNLEISVDQLETTSWSSLAVRLMSIPRRIFEINSWDLVRSTFAQDCHRGLSRRFQD